jgi:hypothetical protein
MPPAQGIGASGGVLKACLGSDRGPAWVAVGCRRYFTSSIVRPGRTGEI